MNRSLARGDFHGETLFIRSVAGTLLAERLTRPTPEFRNTHTITPISVSSAAAYFLKL
jgi:hypothetical protein